jgi:hypothetical protein
MVRLAEDAIKLGKLPPLLFVFAVSLREALPSGQFFDSVAKKLEFIIARCRWFARVSDAAPQSVLEIIEAEKRPVDKTAVESPLYQDLHEPQAWRWRFASRPRRSRAAAVAVR